MQESSAAAGETLRPGLGEGLQHIPPVRRLRGEMTQLATRQCDQHSLHFTLPVMASHQAATQPDHRHHEPRRCELDLWVGYSGGRKDDTERGKCPPQQRESLGFHGSSPSRLASESLTNVNETHLCLTGAPQTRLALRSFGDLRYQPPR